MAYQHKEAFCLMWYECRECGARSRFWNSRDGVTPFITTCPSCGQLEMQHTLFHADICVPNHKPWRGQYVWITLTTVRALEIVDQIIAIHKERGRIINDEEKKQILAGLFQHGDPPDMQIETREWRAPR